VQQSNDFVQRTITLGEAAPCSERMAGEALPQRLSFILICGEIAHQLFTLA
jgi:hypothetical protein